VTDWSNPELNPLGLIHIEQQNPRTAHVSVAMEVKALAYFKSQDGHTYLCAFVDEARQREVFIQTDHGFLEVTDPNVKFVVGKWTNEIMDSRRW